MAYDLNQFITDCRDILARDPGPAGREQVRVNLERLLANKDFVEEYCGDAVPRGLRVLYEDPKLGFQILAHINDKARVSPPHDHGASWAIYGQATKYTDMIEWEHEDDGADCKPFGEFVEHDSGTPSISAGELNAMMRNGTDIKVLDSRPFDEYARISIPTGINVPGAELVLRVRDIVPSPDTTIVVNCAGRTRSIIGAQSLINAGVPNKVVALRNGTMGWHLAGLPCDSGKTARAPAVSDAGLSWATSAAAAIARKFDVRRIDPAKLDEFRADRTRTTYIFDVRDPDEYAAGHFPGAVSAPGGQLVQATDLYAGTLGARIVLSDDKEVRALMTASWLRQMGWKDVFVLPEAGNEVKEAARIVLGIPARDDAIDASAVIAADDVTVIDLSRSTDYRRGHIPGAWFAIRSRLDRAIEKIAPAGDVVLTSEDGVLASLAVTEARRLTQRPVHWLKGGNAAWKAAGFPLSTSQKMADEPVDVWLKPYEQTSDTEAAMNAYLSWEVDLLERIKQDGTTRFVHATARLNSH